MRVQLGLVLITVLVCLAKFGTAAKKEKAYVLLHTDAEARSITTRADAIEYCLNKQKKKIAHLGQLKRDHEERENPHTDCGWTYTRYHPMKLRCKDGKRAKDNRNYCEKLEYVQCDKDESKGVYCNTLEMNTELEYLYKHGELLEVAEIEDRAGILSLTSAKALCETYGLNLAYPDQVTKQMDWYDYSSCEHCWLRQNQAYYSVNCRKMHELDFWVARPENHEPTDCTYCFGIPKDPNLKLTHLCDKNSGDQAFDGKKIHCVDTHGEKDAGILLMARYTCAKEHEGITGENVNCKFSGREWYEYMEGFGRPECGYWLGNRFFHGISQIYNGGLMLQIWTKGDDLNKRAEKYCIWEKVQLGPENKDKGVHDQFSLKLSGDVRCKGIDDQFNKVPSNGNPSRTLNGSPFSTAMRDNDGCEEKEDCGRRFYSGWWYNCCDVNANLFGVCELDEGKYDRVANIQRHWGEIPSEDFTKILWSFVYDKKDNQKDQDPDSEME